MGIGSVAAVVPPLAEQQGSSLLATVITVTVWTVGLRSANHHYEITKQDILCSGGCQRYHYMYNCEAAAAAGT